MTGATTAALAGEAGRAPASRPAAASSRIERVVSPGGIEAWLVRQTQLPILAMSFAFRGGAAQEPAEKAGAANLLAAMLDEGAGELDSEAFHGRLEERAIELSFSAGRDTLTGSIRMLGEHQDEGFALLALALARPRFDAEPLERTRQAILSSIRRASTNPSSIASDTFSAAAFPGHPYGRRTSGTLETVGAIGREDLAALHRRLVARGALKVAVVGDIAAEALGRVLDQVFGPLPAAPDLNPVPRVAMAAGGRRLVPLEVPQTAISFGVAGLTRDDPDFIPAFVMNHVLGGGSFSSRLYTEVRERRGLAYSAGSALVAFDAAGLLSGATSTRNDRAAESLAVIEAELRRMGAEGPTEAELDEAKKFLVGSWALRFETSNQIAANLIRIQLDGFGPDYLDRRNDLIRAVTLDEARRIARRLLAGAPLLVVAVGRPEGF